MRDSVRRDDAAKRRVPRPESSPGNPILGPTQKIPSAEARKIILERVSAGDSIDTACALVGKTRATYQYYRGAWPEWAKQIDIARERLKLGGGLKAGAVPDFPEFCETYLGAKLFTHQLQWFDVLEGRAPRDLHPAQIYRPGDPTMVVINTPPEHAKTTTITVFYSVWRICQDPNVRIIIASKTQSMAVKFLLQIKEILTHPQFRKLQDDFGPVGGYKADSASWSQDKIYISSSLRDPTIKDPTVLALGVGGHIYGARADLVILDDCVDDSNAHQFERQIAWVQGMVYSRLSDEGVLLLVGTRVAVQDLYSEIQSPAYYSDAESPFTYLTQPAVLEMADRTEDWVTLWPLSNIPPVLKKGRALVTDQGLYPKWDGPRLAKKRNSVSPRIWAMMFMQAQVSDDAYFPIEAIKGCQNNMRKAGRIAGGMHGVRPEGMDGLYVVAGLDPATAGYTAAVVLGVDRARQMRYVLDVKNMRGLNMTGMRNLVKELTLRLGVMEWRIEKNAMQTLITQDPEIRDFLAGRGVLLREHTTGTNKWDPDFGVMSMTTLFEGWEAGRNRIELPNVHDASGVRALIEQLSTWAPDATKRNLKTDTVMALWFAEIRARELTQDFDTSTHITNRYLGERSREEQLVVDLDELFLRQGDALNLGAL